MKSTYIVILSALVMALILTGCATPTKLTQTWKNPEFRGGPFHKVMVLALTQKAGKRIMFENEFVKQLNDIGVDAVSSAAVLPRDVKLTRELIADTIKGSEIDAVFVTRLLEVKEDEVYTPPQMQTVPGGYMGHMTHPRVVMVDPGYYTRVITVRLESTLFDTSDAKMVWTAVSETVAPQSAQDLFDSFNKKIIKNLQTTGLLK